MDDLFCCGEPTERGGGIEMNYRLSRPRLYKCGRRPVHRSGAKPFAVIKEQISKFCLTDAHRIRQDDLEHRLQLARRTTDDLQHFGRRRLLFQHFLELAPSACKLLLLFENFSLCHRTPQQLEPAAQLCVVTVG
jgi:hypothetical protein